MPGHARQRRADPFDRVVDRSIVDDDDLVGRSRLPTQRVERGRDVARMVERRHHHAQPPTERLARCAPLVAIPVVAAPQHAQVLAPDIRERRCDGQAEVVPSRGEVPAERLRGTAQQRQSLPAIARLQVDDAEHVDRIGKIGHHVQHLLVERPRRVEPMGALQLECLPHGGRRCSIGCRRPGKGAATVLEAAAATAAAQRVACRGKVAAIRSRRAHAAGACDRHLGVSCASASAARSSSFRVVRTSGQSRSH